MTSEVMQLPCLFVPAGDQARRLTRLAGWANLTEFHISALCSILWNTNTEAVVRPQSRLSVLEIDHALPPDRQQGC